MLSEINNKTCLIGYSGHGFVVTETLLELGFKEIFYADKEEKTFNPFHLKYAGNEQHEYFNWDQYNSFALGIGLNSLRLKIGNLILEKNKEILTIKHSSAIISLSSKIGKGCYISKNVSINPLAIIGNFSIVNTGAIIEHECLLGHAVHIAPGAVLAGNVNIGSGTFLGANSVVKQGITIGENCVIGAGSVVISNIPPNTTYAGNPAKPIIK